MLWRGKYVFSRPLTPRVATAFDRQPLIAYTHAVNGLKRDSYAVDGIFRHI